MFEEVDSLLKVYTLSPPVELFALPNQGVNNRTLGVRTGAGEFVWKTYQTYADPVLLRYEHRLLLWLGAQQLPFDVPVPVQATSGDTLIPSSHGWQALFPRLLGSQPDPSERAMVETVGEGLGKLHAVLAHYSTESRPNMGSYGDLHLVHPHIPDPYSLMPTDLGLHNEQPYDRLLAWWRDELAELRTFIDGPYRALPWQFVHGDFALANTLCRDGQLTAILDFEFALLDARAIDVAAGLSSAIRLWENGEPLVMAQALCRGYARTAQLTGAEIAALPNLLRLREATSMVWWLGRDLVANNSEASLRRLEDMQVTLGWIAEHGVELVDRIAQEA